MGGNSLDSAIHQKNEKPFYSLIIDYLIMMSHDIVVHVQVFTVLQLYLLDGYFPHLFHFFDLQNRISINVSHKMLFYAFPN